jgi:lipopolysaccharide export system protein LptC
MRRISYGLLVVVGLFTVLVGGMLIVRSRAARAVPQEQVTSRADYRIKDVRLQEEAGTVRWQLVADLAEIFEGEGQTRLTKPVVDIQEARRSWVVSGDAGEVHQRTKDVEIRDNVVVESDDGIRLETSVLRWDGQARRLWTDAPVRLIRQGMVVQGTGLEVEMDRQYARVKGRIRAVFPPTKRVAS